MGSSSLDDGVRVVEGLAIGYTTVGEGRVVWVDGAVLLLQELVRLKRAVLLVLGRIVLA